MAQDPILSRRDESVRLDLGGHRALHRIKSSDTAFAFSGRADEFFVGVDALIRDGRASKEALAALMNHYSIH